MNAMATNDNQHARFDVAVAVVVTDRHRVAEILHRGLASQARSQLDLPLFHLVNR